MFCLRCEFLGFIFCVWGSRWKTFSTCFLYCNPPPLLTISPTLSPANPSSFPPSLSSPPSLSPSLLRSPPSILPPPTFPSLPLFLPSLLWCRLRLSSRLPPDVSRTRPSLQLSFSLSLSVSLSLCLGLPPSVSPCPSRSPYFSSSSLSFAAGISIQGGFTPQYEMLFPLYSYYSITAFCQRGTKENPWNSKHFQTVLVHFIPPHPWGVYWGNSTHDNLNQKKHFSLASDRLNRPPEPALRGVLQTRQCVAACWWKR